MMEDCLMILSHCHCLNSPSPSPGGKDPVEEDQLSGGSAGRNGECLIMGF